ncbi:MAG: hypothetical protein GWN85_41580, partial [Gemmatimonadetes bacterium]|nr:hypothetical protein [Gemmatimonadota bacterium]NIR60899.1 hypothetical protein [Gammaproteobacteria bacterium]
MADDVPLTLTRRWFDEWRPRLSSWMARLRDADLPALPDEALDEHLDEVRAYVGDAVDLHFLLHTTQAEPLHALVGVCREVLGWSET